DVALPLQHLSAFLRFFFAFFRQIDVGPASEAVLLVPVALAVADQHQLLHTHSLRKALRPANLSSLPSRSSMRSNWLYLAIRSVRLAEPVLIWPAPVATARSAINGSSVSPERCETIEVYPAPAAIAIASRVSVRLPIWFTLIRIEFAMPSSIPRFSRSVLVTNRSSPTNWILLPSLSVRIFHPFQSSSAIPSSIEMMG